MQKDRVKMTFYTTGQAEVKITLSTLTGRKDRSGGRKPRPRFAYGSHFSVRYKKSSLRMKLE